MNKFGYIRSAAAVPVVSVADTHTNTRRICQLIEKAAKEEVSLLAFPELCTTGYTCGDLFCQQLLLQQAEEAVRDIVQFAAAYPITIFIGAPVQNNGRLYNCAIAANGGKILGIVPKTYLPNYNEFQDVRWFSTGSDFISKHSPDGDMFNISYAGQLCCFTPNQLFEVDGVTVGIEICEDVWAPIPPSSYLAIEGAQIIVNLSASNEVINKLEFRKRLITAQSAQRVLGYIYASAGFGESTTDLVFSGSSMICENGMILAEGKEFSLEPTLIIGDIDVHKLNHLRYKTNTFYGVTPDGDDVRAYRRFFRQSTATMAPETDFEARLYRPISPDPFTPNKDEMDSKCHTALEIQATGLISRMLKIGCKTVVIGVSGGLDSTLALLCAVRAYDKMGWDRKGIIGITMPGFGTSDRTHNNAADLMEELGITNREISIKEACRQHFKDIGHDGVTQDLTYENSQARERTQILMDVANSVNGIVLGTGDLSEIALGWCTYNGDHMSNYSINASLPKTLIRTLVSWAADHVYKNTGSSGDKIAAILQDIVDTPVSPELKGSGKEIEQKTEDNIGPYELHDFFIYYTIRHGFSPEKIKFLAVRAFAGKYSKEEVDKWMEKFINRFFCSQFKRSCAPDGPKVSPISLSPRGDWRMPSDASAAIWRENTQAKKS